MAPVAGKPFLSYVLDYFRQEGITHFIFALGYKSEYFDGFLHATLPPDSFTISLETEPLGTGGAIRQACSCTQDPTVLTLNGDTLFRIDLASLAAFHGSRQADCSLCLRPMRDFDRFGVVELDGNSRVRSFREKQYYKEGLINGGVYALNRRQFLEDDLPAKFSFEKDWLEKRLVDRQLFGLIQDAYFIDIGIPEDYQRAQREFAK
jgi:D-glycero-alpha-D-manno-heptose 1-phosphate guanylyltransferase